MYDNSDEPAIVVRARLPRPAVLAAVLLLCLSLPGCALSWAATGGGRSPVVTATAQVTTWVDPIPGLVAPTEEVPPVLAPSLSDRPFPCAGRFERRELRKPYQTSGDAVRYVLSDAELGGYLSPMGIGSICIPAGLGAPFVNADWQGAETGTTGRMTSIGFEGLYRGAGWSDGFLLYSTYDFSTGSEYDRFATAADRDALRAGTMPDALEINGVPAFVRFKGSDLCLGRCSLYKSIVFPFDDDYVAVVSKVEEYDAGADWVALVEPLRAGKYPPEQKDLVAMMDWLAQSLRFAGGG